MRKRVFLVAALALALAACGSSTDPDSTTTTASATTTTSTTASTDATTAKTADTNAAAASATAPASKDDAASDSATTSTQATTAAETPAAATKADPEAVAAARAKAAKAFVDKGKWVEGKNYFVIEPQQPKVTDTDKIEVVEVFSYGCPACNHAHPFIDQMKAALPVYAQMDYLPAAFRPDENWVVYQRTWYTTKALGIARKSYDAMFDATWKTGETASYDLKSGQLKPKSEWPDINDIAQFFSDKYGVSTKDFLAVANSFAVNTKMKRADDLVKAYGVPGTPTIIVNGKYRFGFQSAGGYKQGIELAQWLVAKVAHETAGK